MGIAVQDVYDTDGKLTGIILDLKDNSQVPDKVVKSAIQVDYIRKNKTLNLR